MKIPIKFGLLTALGFVVWMMLAHLLITDPGSLVHTLIGPIFFNVLHFVMIFLGVRELERQRGEKLKFKEALKTGVAIAFFYALTASLFMVCVIFFAGAKWLAVEPGAAIMPQRMLMLQAFAGLFLGTLVLGFFYSAVIAFFVARRRSEDV